MSVNRLLTGWLKLEDDRLREVKAVRQVVVFGAKLSTRVCVPDAADGNAPLHAFIQWVPGARTGNRAGDPSTQETTMLDTAVGQGRRFYSRKKRRGKDVRVKLTKHVEPRTPRETRSPPEDLKARLRRAARIAFTHFGED
jgi:hypothetical protein